MEPGAGTKRLFAFVALLAALPFFVELSPAYQMRFESAVFLPFHEVTELFSVLVAASIFGVVWYSRPRKQQAGDTLLACAFLAVAVLNLGHLLSFPGMPDFVTPNSASKSIYFWIAFRLVFGAALVAVPLLPAELMLTKDLRRSLLAASLGLTAFVYWLVLFQPESLPAVYAEGRGMTAAKAVAEYFVAALFGISAWLWLRPAQRGRSGSRLIGAASLVLAVSEWCMTAYVDTRDIYIVIGHLYGLVALGLIYAAVFVESVHRPYLELTSSRSEMEVEKERAEITLQSIGDGVIATDRHGHVLSVNSVAQHLIGYTGEEAAGRPFSDVFRLTDESDGTPLPNPVERCLRERRAFFSSNHAMVVSSTGVGYAVEYTASPILDRKAEVIGAVLVFRDVTERKRLQQAMQRSERLFRAIYDTMFQFTWLLSPDGRVLELNRAALAHIHADAEEVVGTPFADTLWWAHSADGQAKLRASIDQAARGLFVRYNATIGNPGGAEIHVDFSIKPVLEEEGKVSMLVVEGRDITEQKRIEDALRRSEASMSDAQRIAHVGSWELDLVAGELTWSDETFHIFEIDPGIFGASYEAFLKAVHPDDRELVAKAYGDSVKDGKSYNVVHRLLFPDGRIKYVNEQGETYYDGDGKPLRSLGTVQDITGQVRSEESLRSAADYARNLIEANPAPMMVTDMKEVITDVNRATEEITGIQRSRLIGRDIADCFVSREDARELLRRVRDIGNVRNYLLKIGNAFGGGTEVSCSSTLYRGENGEVLGTFVVAHDVTELKQYETQMLFQATCDPLTALPNRLQFRERLTQIMAAREFEHVVGVMLIDLDNFKDVNDTLGHYVGDELLKLKAGLLVSTLREGDVVGRMGGDEFAVVMEVSNAQEVDNIAEKLLNTLSEPCLVEGHEIVIGCSIGIALYPFNDSDADALLRNADTAMYRAKAEGKNTYQYFTAEMNDAIHRRVEIGNHLRRAVRKSEFSLAFQPRAELGEGRVSGVEALIRWNSSNLGFVSPAEFIPVAENNGLIVPIGEWVLHTACCEAKRWWLETGVPVNVAVNLSARQFKDADIAKVVLQALDQSGLPAGMLELELTESMLMQDSKRALRTLEALKEIGVSIAVDDFGTGYSSLNYLKSFPIDYLKVDRSFVIDIPNDSNDAAIVRAIISMAHSLGLTVIAEGVESSEQLDFLLAQGCDEIQGYYFSKPLPSEGLAALLKEGRQLDVSYERLNRSRMNAVLQEVHRLKDVNRAS